MKKKMGIPYALIIAMLAFGPIGNAKANQDVTYYADLEAFADEPQVIGTDVRIGGNYCWSSPRPTGTDAKKRLQIFVKGKWRSVGKVVFRKTDTCSKKNPYLHIFEWEIDRLGRLNNKMPFFGTLRVRETTSSPSLYASINIYESVEAINRAREEKIGEFGRVFECVILDGQWDSTRNICVKP